MEVKSKMDSPWCSPSWKMLFYGPRVGRTASEREVARHWPELSHDRNGPQRMLGIVVQLENHEARDSAVNPENRQKGFGGGVCVGGAGTCILWHSVFSISVCSFDFMVSTFDLILRSVLFIAMSCNLFTLRKMLILIYFSPMTSAALTAYRAWLGILFVHQLIHPQHSWANPGVLLYSFFRWRNWGPERLCNSHKVTQLKREVPGRKTVNWASEYRVKLWLASCTMSTGVLSEAPIISEVRDQDASQAILNLKTIGRRWGEGVLFQSSLPTSSACGSFIPSYTRCSPCVRVYVQISHLIRAPVRLGWGHSSPGTTSS